MRRFVSRWIQCYYKDLNSVQLVDKSVRDNITKPEPAVVLAAVKQLYV